jgi:alpha-ribazole phosphatase
MQLVLVRHPRPDIEPGICYGSSDVASSAAATASVLAALRAKDLPGTLPVYASPLMRCADLARQLDVPVAFDTRLAEMDFGAWEMRAWDAIPRAEVDAWAADLLHYRPGGGESVLEVAHRVAAFRDELGQHDALLICTPVPCACWRPCMRAAASNRLHCAPLQAPTASATAKSSY